MALASASPFASFDVTDGSQQRDISPVLEDAIYYDLNLLSAIGVDLGNPVYDNRHYWNEENLNADTTTLNGSVSSAATTLTVDSQTVARIGDQVHDQTSGSTEVMQVTGTAATSLTVTRGYNSTTQASIADNAVLVHIRSEQEGSDIGSDGSLNPSVRSNYTQIIPALDLLVSGTQIARRMATNELQDFVARQLAARALELRINWSRAILYSEISASAGSDTVYRAMGGLRYWIRDNSGVTDSVSEATGYADLNANNKSVVDKGVFPDTLVIPTDLVGSISGIDSSVRRLRESDTTVGYVVQDILLNQGNMVQVVVDSRCDPGDYFLFDQGKLAVRPLNGRGMFVIAARDFADAQKRRVLSELTMEVRNPQAAAYAYSKS